jgi:hypothetical protein
MWGFFAVVCIGGPIYLAWTGSWGWLVVVPFGLLAARRAAMYTREINREPPESTPL